jgi:hypothetical protein
MFLTIASLRDVRVVLYRDYIMFTSVILEVKQIERYNEIGGGIYVWLYRPKKLQYKDLDRLRTLYSSFELSLSAKSKVFKFKDNIEGELRRVHLQDEKQYSDIELEFLQTFVINHGMPIYIGRTNSFKTRLAQHLKSYHEELSSLRLLSLSSPRDDEADMENIEMQDTPLESSVFGRRLAKINVDQWIRLNELSIYLYKFREDQIESVKRCEYFLNRLYRPILGTV